jgi:hypothetical protein
MTYVQSGPYLFLSNGAPSLYFQAVLLLVKMLSPRTLQKVKLWICPIRQAPRMLAAPVVTSADSMPQTRPPDVVIKDFVFASEKMEIKNTIKMEIYTR